MDMCETSYKEIIAFICYFTSFVSGFPVRNVSAFSSVVEAMDERASFVKNP